MITSTTGKVAVVTGAASGIGRELAYGLGRRGCRLAISDVDETGLAETAGTLRSSGVEVHAVRLDVADRAAVAGYASTVAEHYGVVHQLYNNAGVGVGRHLTEMSYADFDRVLQINLWGVVHGTKEFLPHLIASGNGHLVNISSINGFLAQPGLSAYCTSKFAVRGFTETVRAEMIVDRHPVRVTVVHPGGVRTNIATATLAHARATGYPVTAQDQRNTDFYNEKLLLASATAVAETILVGVARGRSRVIVGTHGRKVDVISRLAPAWAPFWGAQLHRAMSRS
ncbi:MAG TPA: SDR family oxidoreductase [Microlunatus sp.]